MDFFETDGYRLLSNAATVCALLIVAGNALAAGVTAFYQRFWYDSRRRKSYSPPALPRCSVIIPCKGAIPGLKENLQTFLMLDYPDYEVLFTVESEDDPAVPIIRPLCDTVSNARLVVAGHAHTCAQKNFNLLAALRETGDPEIYVFADGDIGPAHTWLRELVLPFSDPAIAITSGFSWLVSPHGTFGEQVHVHVNAFIYLLFSVASLSGGVGLWGGSMAIRKKDFEEMDVAGRWAETVVDDISLSDLSLRHKKRSILVPRCITRSTDPLPKAAQAIAWMQRQIMFLKYYHRNLWAFAALPTALLTLALFLWPPVLFGVSIGIQKSFWDLGGAASLLLPAGLCVSTLLYRLFGPIRNLALFALCAPAFFCAVLIAYFKTLFTNTIVWSGISYHIRFNGTVREVKR